MNLADLLAPQMQLTERHHADTLRMVMLTCPQVSTAVLNDTMLELARTTVRALSDMDDFLRHVLSLGDNLETVTTEQLIASLRGFCLVQP